MGPSNDGSLFRTTANTQFNSFQNPLPTLNMSGPGWGVDQSYLTPSYAAPYRPGYQEEAITSGRPGFFHSVHNQFNPMASDGYAKWQNPFLGQQQYRESMVPRAADAAAWTAQNIGVGTAAFWLGGKAVGMMARAGGHAGTWAMGASWGQSAFTGVARGAMGAGLASSNIGGAMGISGAAGAIGRGVGGLFGSIALPLMAAQAIVGAGDSTVFDPYSNTKSAARSMRENFSGITFGGGEQGNPYTGRGLSFSSSSNIAGQVTRSGFRNWSMSGKEISGISDLASRAGLLENVNPDQFAKQISSITKQVAIIAAVANDPDFKNSIEIMAKLKDAGMNVSSAGSFMSKFGSTASIAGVSVKRMMEMGTQGQFLFGANNLTPYLGMEQYAQSYSSFAAASRNGLVSPALLARMGGVGGATQSALTGMVNATQTPYNQVLMSNQYLSGMGGTSGNLTGNLGRFGQSIARDPMGMAGAMGLHAGAMGSAQMKSRGILGTQDQIMDIAKTIPGMINPDGTLDDGKAFMIAKNVMGLDQTQAEALVVQLRNGRDPRHSANMMAGNRSAFKTSVATLMDAEGLSGLKPVVAAKMLGKNMWASVAEVAHDNLVSPFISAESRVADKLGVTVDEMKYGKFSELQGEEVDLATASGGSRRTSVKGFELQTLGNAYLNQKGDTGRAAKDFLEAVSVMAGAGNSKANDFLGAGSKEGRNAAMKALIASDPKLKALAEKSGHLVNDVLEDSFYGKVTGKVVDLSSNAVTDAVEKYSGKLDKYGFSSQDVVAAANYKGNAIDDPTGAAAADKVNPKLLSASKALLSQHESFLKDYAANKQDGESEQDYAKRRYGSKSAALLAQGGTVKMSDFGNDRIDMGGKESSKKYNEIRAGFQEQEDTIRKARTQGRITSSTYTAEISKLAGEEMLKAADLMLKAGQLQLKAAGGKDGDAPAVQGSTAGYATMSLFDKLRNIGP